MNKEKSITLDDIVTVVNDNEYEPIKKGVKKYVAGGHIEPEKFYVKKFGSVVEDKEVIGSAFHKLFKKGHILYKTRFPNSGAIATFDGLCSNTTLVLKRKDNSNLIDGLLPFILKWDRFDEFLIRKSVGSTNNYIRWRDMAEFRFVLPSISEQIKLKDLFWGIQNSIDCLEEVIEKTKNYEISRRESLLSQGISHTKFKKIIWLYGKEVKIPEKWEIKNLDNICSKIVDGPHTSPNYVEKGILFLTVNNIMNGFFDVNNAKQISKKDHKIYSQRANPEFGDVLYTKGGTTGIAKLIDIKLEFSICFGFRI